MYESKSMYEYTFLVKLLPTNVFVVVIFSCLHTTRSGSYAVSLLGENNFFNGLGNVIISVIIAT